MATDGTASGRRSHVWMFLVLFLGLALAIAGNIYQFVRGEQVARDVALLEQNMQSQIAKMSDAAVQNLEANQQRFDDMKKQFQDQTAAAVRQARSEVKRTNGKLTDSLEKKHREIADQLSNFKQDTSDRFDKVSSDLDQTGADLKRAVGDLGIMSGEVATNSKELATLKQLGERNYFEFDLTKTKDPQRVGDIRLKLRKTDPKHNKYTLDVLADDRTIEKKDRTLNEPVQLYVAGARQPYEIVINQVKKNEVIGYLATPKVKIPRGQQQASE